MPLDLYALLSDPLNNESDATGHAISTVWDKSSDRVIRSAPTFLTAVALSTCNHSILNFSLCIGHRIDPSAGQLLWAAVPPLSDIRFITPHGEC